MQDETEVFVGVGLIVSLVGTVTSLALASSLPPPIRRRRHVEIAAGLLGTTLAGALWLDIGRTRRRVQ